MCLYKLTEVVTEFVNLPEECICEFHDLFSYENRCTIDCVKCSRLVLTLYDCHAYCQCHVYCIEQCLWCADNECGPPEN